MEAMDTFSTSVKQLNYKGFTKEELTKLESRFGYIDKAVKCLIILRKLYSIDKNNTLMELDNILHFNKVNNEYKISGLITKLTRDNDFLRNSVDYLTKYTHSVLYFVADKIDTYSKLVKFYKEYSSTTSNPDVYAYAGYRVSTILNLLSELSFVESFLSNYIEDAFVK